MRRRKAPPIAMRRRIAPASRAPAYHGRRKRDGTGRPPFPHRLFGRNEHARAERGGARRDDEGRIADLSRDIARCREAHPEIDIVFGFEADWYEGCERDIEAVRGNATFLIESVHYLGEYAVDWLDDMRIWDEAGPDEVWRRYVEGWRRACFCPVGFDSMAHPDLVRLFEKSGYAPSVDLAPLWDEMAQAARDAGVRVEVSTAGLRKPLSDFLNWRERSMKRAWSRTMGAA